MQWVIYTLADPRTGEVRYVGWTVNLKRRLVDHLKPSQLAKRQRRSRWLKLLVEAGMRPVATIVEHGAGESWGQAECRWIAHYRTLGADLTNHTDGGQGTPGRRHSPETKARWSAIRKGRPPSEASKAATSALHKGVSLSPDHRAKIGAALKGRKFSAFTRAKISEARRGTSLSSETRKKISESLAGRVLGARTPETLANVRTAARNPERRAKVSAAKKLYWQSRREAKNAGG